MSRLLLVAAAVALLLAGCTRDPESGKPPAAAGIPAGIPPAGFDPILEHFNRGVALLEQYRYAEAITAFERVVELAPDWTTGRLNLGIALLNGQGDDTYVRAEAELRKVLEGAPESPHAHYALGMLLYHLRRLDESRVEFGRVLEIDPEDGDAHYRLGILLSSSDPEAARSHLEKTLEIIPHHESACYRLQMLLRQAGENEPAKALLDRFQELKSSGSGVFAGTKYGEMGRYADIIRAFPDPGAARVLPEALPVFEDVAERLGFTAAAAGEGGWPGEEITPGAAALAPGVAVADVDGDADLDVYLTALGPDGAGALYLNEGGTFTPAAGSGIDGGGAVGAWFGDHDADGDADLFLTRAGPNRLFRNDGDGRFEEITGSAGVAGGAFLSAGAAWADADHDGDLDIYVANLTTWPAGAGGAPNRLWRNNRDGTFSERAAVSGIDGGDAPSMGVLFLDTDGDRDLDIYVINHRAPNRLFLNDRIGDYTDATARHARLAGGGPGLGALLGDVDRDGREDLLLVRGPEPPRLFRQVARGRFEEDADFAEGVKALGGAAGALLADIDLDGDLDLALLDAGGSGGHSHRLLINDGAGGFVPRAILGAARPQARARGAVAADLDGDGTLELIVAQAGGLPQLWRAPPLPGRHWLEVLPSMQGPEEARLLEPTATGLLVEVKSGRLLQVGRSTSSAGYLGSPPPRLHFGLQRLAKADYVRLLWADSVLQSELEVPADQLWRVAKVSRKPSSCPVLFSWDGERFAFVTDFLGVGGVGFFVAPGEYAPPDPSEAVRIPPELIEPRDGRYLLRVTEPLEEVSYIDELRLVVYDHPAGWELYPDERFPGAGPLPTGEALAVADRIFPVAACDGRGLDLTERLLDIDRRYAEPPRDERFAGYAEDHWVELDFGDRLQGLDGDRPLKLFLHGWVEYTYSHVNYAASQAGLGMAMPSIEVPDGKGGWRAAMPEAGFPAGLPRMMALDVTDLRLDRDPRLRIRTNMEIYWDQIFLAEDRADSRILAHRLPAKVAELRPLGYPREFSPDGNDPTIYDYHRLDRGVPFKNMAGDYTRHGDVGALLEAVDDRFVIMARGDEIALEFDAAALPPLPAGYARTLVLHTHGYCKDMDLYTAHPDTVGPLPFHGMGSYPPTPDPEREALRHTYRSTWNTRRIEGEGRRSPP